MSVPIAPTISEVQSELGKCLATAFFSECPASLKSIMGLQPSLEGAGENLWTSPSDTLIGKICLKPPLTNRHIKALTHSGILNIGHDVEIKFKNEANLEKQKALAEEEEILLFMAELDQREIVQKTLTKEKKKCAMEKDEIAKDFEKKLHDELLKLEETLKAEENRQISIQKQTLERWWEEKLEQAVTETASSLNDQFLQEASKKEQKMFDNFKIEIKKENIKRELDVKSAEESCKDNFVQLKHELQCNNIANIMYILCTERRNCQIEYERLENNYRQQIELLQNNLTVKEKTIAVLTTELQEKTRQVQMREEYLMDVIRQYQKFINFALNTAPTQAEFLLDVEKMMIFDLAQAVAESNEIKQQTQNIFPWKLDGTEATSSNKKRPLVPKDYHDCNNEIDRSVTEQEVKSSDYLPALRYDEHMYVREDFRNMMSQGIYISPSNTIWNRDVDNLMQTLKTSLTDIKRQNLTKEDQKRDNSIAMKCTNQPQVSIATVQFQNQEEHAIKNELLPIFESSSSKLFETVSDLYDELSASAQSKRSTHQLPKCCNCCTQTYHKYSGVAESTEQLQPNETALMKVRDSLIKHRSSLKHKSLSDGSAQPIYELKSINSPSSLTHSECDTKLSKLSLTRNSLAIHKQSLGAKQRSNLNRLDKTNKLDLSRHINSKLASTTTPVVSTLMGVPSKLSLTKDSLELLRSQSSKVPLKLFSKENLMVTPLFIKLEDDSLQSTKMSHTEIVPIGGIDDGDDHKVNALPWHIYDKQSEKIKPTPVIRDNFLKKPKMAKVVGDRTTNIHLQKHKDFTLHKANSLLNIFRKNPSLIKIFTSCTK